jgi:two-component system NtrC family sensor kinase
MGVRPFATSREQGTGLGLVMVRRFVTDLGGQLQLENREPHGACIRFYLPCLVEQNDG